MIASVQIGLGDFDAAEDGAYSSTMLTNAPKTRVCAVGGTT